MGFNSSALHKRQQLVGDLGEDVLSQPGHAEDLVTGSVNVVSEWNKLKATEHNSVDTGCTVGTNTAVTMKIMML